MGEQVHGVDFYELLGVDREASTAEIKSAYRVLARSMHPDMGGTTGTFRLLREAYETLNDPVRRADYDGTRTESPASEDTVRRRPRSTRRRDFGDDPAFVPGPPRVPTEDIPWWYAVDPFERVRYLPITGPDRTAMTALIGGWVLLLLAGLAVQLRSVALVLWLTAVVAAGTVVLVLVRRQLEALRVDRLFAAEFGGRVVFGRPGAGQDELAQPLTADVLEHYLTRLPGVRIFHGLAWPGSVFADIDHAVLCGRRLVLIESKRWLPGHYTIGEQGYLWRNGHRFRGGMTRLPEGIAEFQAVLPDVEVCGALLVYPSRAGEITTSEPSDLTLTPDQFIREMGSWLAEDPATVDRDVFRRVQYQVVSG